MHNCYHDLGEWILSGCTNSFLVTFKEYKVTGKMNSSADSIACTTTAGGRLPHFSRPVGQHTRSRLPPLSKPASLGHSSVDLLVKPRRSRPASRGDVRPHCRQKYLTAWSKLGRLQELERLRRAKGLGGLWQDMIWGGRSPPLSKPVTATVHHSLTF